MEFRRSIDTIGAGQECQTATKIGRFLLVGRERAERFIPRRGW